MNEWITYPKDKMYYIKTVTNMIFRHKPKCYIFPSGVKNTFCKIMYMKLKYIVLHCSQFIKKKLHSKISVKILYFEGIMRVNLICVKYFTVLCYTKLRFHCRWKVGFIGTKLGKNIASLFCNLLSPLFCHKKRNENVLMD